MAVQMRDTIRAALGEAAAAELQAWVEQIVAEKAMPRDEYRHVIARMDVVEHGLADVKTDLRDLRREMSERFDRVNERFDHMNERFDQMYDRMLVQTRWMVGTIAIFGTLITALLAISQFAA